MRSAAKGPDWVTGSQSDAPWLQESSPLAGKRSPALISSAKAQGEKDARPATHHPWQTSSGFGKSHGAAHFKRRLWGLLIAGWAGHRKRPRVSVFREMLPGDKILKPIPTLALQAMALMILSALWACGQMDSKLGLDQI